MVPLIQLWMPIILAAVLVFIAASILWTVLPLHKSDFTAVPEEDALQTAFRAQQLTPGQYMVPYVRDPAMMKDPAFVEKLTRGPVASITVFRPGPPTMGKQLVQYFIYQLAVSFMTAYVAGRTMAPGTHYLQVYRVTATVAILAYAGAAFPSGIWFGRPWRNVAKDVFDGFVFSMLTAGTFAWLWPR
jgi:hypothetical protein